MRSKELQLFFTALMFFSRIPCPAWVEYNEENLKRSAKYLPLVGVIIGSLVAIVYWLAHFIFPQSVAILLSMIASLLLTGAFHEDGFADACDGFGGGNDRDSVLRIMQDPRIGSFGAIATVMLLLLKFETLTHINTALLPATLIAAHALSRFSAISFVYTHDYVRAEGTGKSSHIAQRTNRTDLSLAAVFGLIPLLAFDLVTALFIVGVIAIARWQMAKYFTKRLGGYSGDCLGMAQQLSEVLIYLCILGTWAFI